MSNITVTVHITIIIIVVSVETLTKQLIVATFNLAIIIYYISTLQCNNVIVVFLCQFIRYLPYI